MFVGVGPKGFTLATSSGPYSTSISFGPGGWMWLRTAQDHIAAGFLGRGRFTTGRKAIKYRTRPLVLSQS